MTEQKLAAPRNAGVRSVASIFSNSSTAGIAAVYVVLCIVFALLSPRFLSISNFSIILGQTSAIMIAGFAMTMVILSGGIDLSVGAVVALSGVALATLLQAHVPAPLAVIAAIGVAGIVGLVNGAVTVRFRVQPFLVTLGTLSIARGGAELLAHGGTVPILDTHVIDFFAGYFGPVPIPAVWMLGFLLASIIVLRHTLFGRRLYAIGGNEQAAVQAGTNVGLVKVIVYLLSGLFTGVASMISTSRLSAGLPGAGVGFELDVIAAVVLGGTGFRGEGGSVVGTLFGALIIGTVSNGLTLMGVDPLVQKVVKGLIILLAIVFEALRYMRRNQTT